MYGKNINYAIHKIKKYLKNIYYQFKRIDTAPEYVPFHITLLMDRVRTESLKQAICETVKPNKIVLDIGTGSGILSFFACQAGAKKVYAVERSPIIKIAQKMAEYNGLKDKITFINEESIFSKLPEKVDVIISETIGSCGLEENILNILLDAKKRFLKQDGIFIPKGLKYFVTPVSLKESATSSLINIFNTKPWGLDFSPMIKNIKNRPIYIPITQLQEFEFLSIPEETKFIDFKEIETDSFTSKIKIKIQRDSDVSGIITYFHTYLTDNIIICPEKLGNNISWSSWCVFIFFPFPMYKKVKAGEIFTLSLSYTQKSGWQIQTFP